jgi:Right handed beta helix region
MPVPSTIADLSTTAASNSPAGSEAILPNLDNYLRAHASFIAQNYTARPISVHDYGAVGNGATDDTAAFVAAAAEGTHIVLKGGSTYYVTPLAFTSSLSMSSDGPLPAVVYCDSTPASPVLQVSGTAKTATTLSAAAQTNDMIITVASAANIAVGDLLKIQGLTLWQSDNRGILYTGQMAKVLDVIGTDIYLESSIASGVASGSSVTPITPVTVYLSNIEFKRPLTTGSSAGIGVLYGDGGMIRDCYVENCSRTGIQISNCYETKALDNRIKGARLAVSETRGYGVQVVECWAVSVHGTIAHECRRGVDLTGTTIPSYYCSATGSHVYGGGIADDGSTEFWPLGVATADGVGSHGGTEGSTFEGNTLYNLRGAIVIRGRNETVRNNTIVGWCERPLDVIWGAGLLVEGNRYLDQFEEVFTTPGDVSDATSIAARPAYFIYLNVNGYDFDTHFTVRNNVARNVRESFIYLDGDAGIECSNMTLVGNDVYIEESTSGVASLLKSASVKYVPSFVEHTNQLHAPDGFTYSKYSGVQLNQVGVPSVSQTGPNTYRVTIPDDEVVEIPIGWVSGQVFLRMFPWSSSTSPRFNGSLRYESSVSVDFGGTTGVTVGATALTGTTGTDGDTTISMSGGIVYIENRSAAEKSYLVSIEA